MDDGLHVLVRWALYLDLALTAGLPLAALLAFRRDAARMAPALGLRRLLIALAGIGLLLSVCHLAMLAQVMSGAAAMTDLDGEVFATVLGHTDAGIAWWMRIAALCGIALLALYARSRAGLPMRSLSALGAVSLATVAWTGHAAMDEGARAYLHMAVDIVHLIAAAAWIGALAIFALLLRPRQAASLPQLRLLHMGLARFAWQGTAIVFALAGTGVVNYCLAASPRLSGLMTTEYGLLLVAKLALVAAMIGLAAGNRYRLVPALGAGHRSPMRRRRGSRIAQECPAGSRRRRGDICDCRLAGNVGSIAACLTAWSRREVFSGLRRHGSAGLGAPLASLGALLAMIHLVLSAFLRAGRADLGAQRAYAGG